MGKGRNPRPVEWNREGRVLCTEFEGWKLAIVDGHWPNGTGNMWRDSETGGVRGTRHHMKRTFHAHVLGEVEAREGRREYGLLVGNVNVARSSREAF